jgi:ribonuclease Z
VPRPVTACRAGKATVLACALDHGIDCQGYRLQEDDGVRMLPEKLAEAGVTGPAVRQLLQAGQIQAGERLVRLQEVSEARPGQAFALLMDTRLCPGAEALARGADLLVCEATYQHAEAQEAHDHYHLTARQAAELAVKSGVRRLALTHFSQRYPSLEGFEQEASAVHPDVFCAEDLSQVSLPKRREC